MFSSEIPNRALLKMSCCYCFVVVQVANPMICTQRAWLMTHGPNKPADWLPEILGKRPEAQLLARLVA